MMMFITTSIRRKNYLYSPDNYRFLVVIYIWSERYIYNYRFLVVIYIWSERYIYNYRFLVVIYIWSERYTYNMLFKI